MREHLFRAKRVDNREWETGSIVVIRGGCSDESVYIADKMTGYLTPVIPETVGQYTGLCDKNGKKIFEGDIISSNSNSKFIIKWNKSNANFVCGYVNKSEDYFRDYYCNLSDKYIKQNFNVIGNIHDNEELLEVEE